MRHVPLRWGKWVVPVCVLSLGFALPATASAQDTSSAKLDRSARALLRSPLTTPWSTLRVIAIGDARPGDGGASFRIRRSFRSLHGDGLTISAADLMRLVRSRSVRFVTADAPVEASASAAAPAANGALQSLFPQLVGAPEAWSQGLHGEGVGIAVIDSGVASTVDLGSRLVDPALGGRTGDHVGHGTFVAGVAAGDSGDGRYLGIAPRATVYALNVARDGGVFTSDVIAGLDWVFANHVAKNIRVVNLSLNEAVRSSYLSSVLCTAVERLWRAGVVVVVSSGNTGAGSVSHAPANDPFAITVGALDANDTLVFDDDRVADWSSRGETADQVAKPELLAPGRHVVSTLPSGTALAHAAPQANLVEPGYAMLNGTSFAAPQVAAAAALVLQQHPEYTPDMVKWLLTQESRDLATGEKALDVAAAVGYAGLPQAANAGLTAGTYGLVGANGVALDAAATWDASATWN